MSVNTRRSELDREPCVFCSALSPDRAPRVPVDYDRPLYANEHFVIMPALGALTVGHVLVVGREHVSGLSYLSSEALQSYDKVVKVAQSITGDRNALEAEHGGSHSDRGGACISHTHVNFIPDLPSVISMLDSQLPRLTDPLHTSDLRHWRDQPYVFLRQGRETRLLAAAGVPSQLIRRRLCDLLRQPEPQWDWVVYPNLAIVQETVALWARRIT